MAAPTIVTSSELNTRQTEVVQLVSGRSSVRKRVIDWMDMVRSNAAANAWGPSADRKYLSGDNAGPAGSIATVDVGGVFSALAPQPTHRALRLRARMRAGGAWTCALRRCDLASGAVATLVTLTADTTQTGLWVTRDSGVLAIDVGIDHAWWLELTTVGSGLCGFAGALLHLEANV